MKIWWCLEHETNGAPDGCRFGVDCQMVATRLTPDDAEALERAAEALCDWEDSDGHLHEERYREAYRQGVRIVLAALDGETP